MSKIEWTEKTWNPVTGCTKISPGCANCYAERMSKRLQAMGLDKYKAGFDTVVCHPDTLDIPLRRKKPTTYFVNSMGDLFHEDVPFSFVARIFNVAMRCHYEGKGHTFIFLTKRPERMATFFREAGQVETIYGFPVNRKQQWTASLTPNVWLGVTAENQEQADKRIPILLQIPAAVRFVSCEPMLSFVDFSKWLGYNPIYENNQKSGNSSIPSCDERGTTDRQQGASLAGGQERLGSLEQESTGEQMPEGTGRASAPIGLPSSQSDVSGGSSQRDCAPSCIHALQRRNPSRIDGEPQERGQERQSSEESGVDDALRADYSCPICSQEGQSHRPGRGKERNVKIDGSKSQGNPSTSPERGASTEYCEGLRDQLSDSIKDSPPTKLASLDLIIVGCESGPGRRHCDNDWIRQVVADCRSAEVPVFVKQIQDKDGKVIKDIDRFPPDLQFRQRPGVA